MVSTAECALVQLRSIRLAAALRGVNCVIKGRGKGGGQEQKKIRNNPASAGSVIFISW